MRRLLLLTLVLLPAWADGPPAPPPPTEKQVAAAQEELKGGDPERLLSRLEALDVAERSKDPSFVPLLFESAVTTQQPDFAVRAGEVANLIDAEAAAAAYGQGKRKLRKFALANAARFLGEVKHASSGRALVELAKSSEAETRVEALYGLVKQADPANYGPILSGFRATEKDVKVPAAICCGLARIAEATDLLLKGLEDDEQDLAYFCAWALGQMKNPALLATVISATRGRMSGEIGVAKAKAIMECAFDPQSHIPILLDLVGSSDESLAAAAAIGLGRLGAGNAAAADALLNLMVKARSATVAALAADCFGRIGTPEHGEKLLGRYENNPGNIPPYVIRVLGLVRCAKAAGLLQHLAYTQKDAMPRKRAAIAFWECADDAARQSFQDKLESATTPKQIAAGCQILGFDRSDSGFQFALKLLRKHFGKRTIEHVRDALERMTGHRFSPVGAIWMEWYGKNADFFARKPQFLSRDEWRKKLLASKEEMGISRLTEEAVERGLGWLARHQSPDGRWSGDRFIDRCELYYNKACQIGARLGDWDVGMTGISLLAFFGAGYRPEQGRYKDTILRAQIYCAARQWADGDFGGQGDLIGGYSRPIATIALAEAYGTTQDPEYLERTRLSVEQIIRIQYPDAGWRYRLGGQFPGDTSVTGWNAWAIATARKFGIPVDPSGLEGALSLFQMFSSPVTQDEEYYNTDPGYFFEVGRGQTYDHFTGYNAREASRPPMTALGLMCYILMDRRRSHPFCIGAANTLLKNIPEYDERANKIKYVAGAEYPIYYWYYGSLAMYQMGGSFWRKWSRPLLTDGIPNTQVKGDVCERGSWGCDNLDSIGGRVYSTAMGVLTLETFYRYLPVLQGR